MLKVFNTPVAYIVFNRPRQTALTLAAIREQRPSNLFIIADGPRPGHPTDTERCAEVRAIVDHVDWPCEVHRNYAETNLGLKRRVSTGLDWVFGQVDRAIVLEDDCLPHPDFFTFCDTLLDRYAQDERVWVVTGNNFQNGRRRGEASYYFSKYNHCWGWASWRRAWRHYQGDLPFWPDWKDSRDWCKKTADPVERRYWGGIFNRVRAGAIDSWAYPWTGSAWYHGGLTATPNVNLVTNIGFGSDGTHCYAPESQEGLPVQPLGQITHPAKVVQDRRADRYVFDHTFGGLQQRWPCRLRRLPRRIAGSFYRMLKTIAVNGLRAILPSRMRLKFGRLCSALAVYPERRRLKRRRS